MEKPNKFSEIKKLNLYLERDPILDITPEKNLIRECKASKVKFNENVDVFLYHQDHCNREFVVDPSNSFVRFGYNQYDDDLNNSHINHEENENIDDTHHHGYTCITNNNYNSNNYAVYDENITSCNLSNNNSNQFIELSSSDDQKNFEISDSPNEYINNISPTTFVPDVQDYDVNDYTNEPSYDYKEYDDIHNEDIMKEFEEILGPSSFIYGDDDDDTWWDDDDDGGYTWWDDEIETNYETEMNKRFTNNKRENTKPLSVYKTPLCNKQNANRSINENKIYNNINKNTRIQNLRKSKENQNCISSNYNTTNYNRENNFKNHKKYSLQNITNNVDMARNQQDKVFNKDIKVCGRGISDKEMVDLEKPLLNGSKRLIERLRKTKLQCYTGDELRGSNMARKLCKQASVKLNVQERQFENLIPLEVDSEKFLEKVVKQKLKKCKR